MWRYKVCVKEYRLYCKVCGYADMMRYLYWFFLRFQHDLARVPSPVVLGQAIDRQDALILKKDEPLVFDYTDVAGEKNPAVVATEIVNATREDAGFYFCTAKLDSGGVRYFCMWSACSFPVNVYLSLFI